MEFLSPAWSLLQRFLLPAYELLFYALGQHPQRFASIEISGKERDFSVKLEESALWFDARFGADYSLSCLLLGQ